MIYEKIIRPLLFKCDPEKIHEVVRFFGEHFGGVFSYLNTKIHHPGNLQLLNLKLRHPFGLAAGFDKNGEMIPFLEFLGFSFIEIGSVTNKPWSGNPRPRIFRPQRMIINRMS
jgi:dihydroorotate dehydrogenase